MSLWMHWWNAIWRLRPAFSRLQTFLWFATAVAGFTVRSDMLGVRAVQCSQLKHQLARALNPARAAAYLS
jgi:hypothetical protein